MIEENNSKSELSSEDGVESFLFEYSLFLLTAARGTIDEPKIYGALRLVDGISRLTEIYSKSADIERDEFLLGIGAEIRANLDRVLKSEDEFAQFMDNLIVKFTDEMKRRYTTKH